jgi:hypothetical protein
MAKIKPDKSLVPGLISTRDSIIESFHAVGGMESFTAWAKDNPTTFYTQFWVKLLDKPAESLLGQAGRLEIVWGSVEDAEIVSEG